MFRFFEFVPGLFVNRDSVDSITAVTVSSNSHNVVMRVNGVQYNKTFFTFAEAEAERDRILNEEL